MPISLRCRPILPLALLVGVSVALAAPGGASAEIAASPTTGDLADLSLEELMNIEVTSVSKHPQRLEDAAAAVHVITREDIRRSGATSLPDLLRAVPGLEVAQASPVEWAISARGFNSVYADKLLVLVDGRSVYSPAFAGVFWDVEAPPLETIERIEVILGPGGTLWGANAVSGVINIITQGPTAALQGTAVVDGGAQAQAHAYLSYGGEPSGAFSQRIYVDGERSRGPAQLTTGEPRTVWQGAGGYRAAWRPTDQDDVAFELGYDRTWTDLSTGRAPEVPALLWRNTDAHAMLSWIRRFADGADTTVQGYYDQLEIASYGQTQSNRTYDVEARGHLKVGDRHEIVVGAGYRLMDFSVGATPGDAVVAFDHPTHLLRTWNAFAQDEIALGARWQLTAGLKLEHAYAGGLQAQPTLRLLWKPSESQTVWAAVSRSVRTPSVGDLFIRARPPIVPGVAILAIGNPAQHPETLLAYELGYRRRLGAAATLDASAFYNQFQDLAAAISQPGPGSNELVLRLSNEARGHVWGGEIAAKWQVTSAWRVVLGYDAIRRRLAMAGPDVALVAEALGGDTPASQLRLQSFLDLPHGFEVDGAAFRVGRLARAGLSAYTRVDARLGWRPASRLELGLAGENLGQPRHVEFLRPYGEAAEVHRSVRAYLRSRF